MAKLRDIAKACKSKNAGPFEITIDVMFEDAETFEAVRRTGVICPQLFARLYGVPAQAVQFSEYPPAFAFKASFERPLPSGAVGDTDVYGAQQHAPLLDVEVPVERPAR
jgi:hypothetical protein